MDPFDDPFFKRDPFAGSFFGSGPQGAAGFGGGGIFGDSDPFGAMFATHQRLMQSMLGGAGLGPMPPMLEDLSAGGPHGRGHGHGHEHRHGHGHGHAHAHAHAHAHGHGHSSSSHGHGHGHTQRHGHGHGHHGRVHVEEVHDDDHGHRVGTPASLVEEPDDDIPAGYSGHGRGGRSSALRQRVAPQHGGGSYSYSSSTSTVIGPGGVYESKHYEGDSTGRERLARRRGVGERAHEVRLDRAEGQERRFDTFAGGLDEGQVDQFDREWEGRWGTARGGPGQPPRVTATATASASRGGVPLRLQDRRDPGGM